MNVERSLQRLVNNEKRSGGFREYSPVHIARLLELYGNPHHGLAAVHIAGTNGKGSTAHMIASISRAAGHLTGLYTSPHLVRVAERIRVDGAPIPTAILARYCGELFDMIDANPGITPTYFDALTLFAIRYFRDRRVDLSVIETGLGGRLDSTNVIDPLVSVITDIGLDHTRLLGDTVVKIAREKAGIIKNGTAVVTTNDVAPVVGVLESACANARSRLYRLGIDFFADFVPTGAAGDIRYSIRIPDDGAATAALERMPLGGRANVQARNAAAAAMTGVILAEHGFRISPAHIRRGVAARVPGRMQQLSREPRVIFDPAHNPAAMRAVIDTVIGRYPGSAIIAVVTFMKEKDAGSMVRALADHCNAIYYLNMFEERSLRLPGPAGKRSWERLIESVDDPAALVAALASRPLERTVVLFTGSFRLYGHARACARALSSARTVAM